MFTGGIVRKVGCVRYNSCLRRAVAKGKGFFSCENCQLYESEILTETDKLIENLRAARLRLEIWPELATADPATHEDLNAAFDLPSFKASASETTRRAFTMTVSC